MSDLTPERLDLIRSSCRRSVATSDKYPLITMDAAEFAALLDAAAERAALAAAVERVPEAVSDDRLHRDYGPLTPVLDTDGHLVPEMAKLAKAWAEGYVLGSQDAAANHCSEWRPNPYRQATA